MPEEHINLFEQLYRYNHSKVYRLALSLCGNEHDAEDITQEAFLKAFRSYDSFREESSFFTWIYRITINITKDYMKYRDKFPINALTEDLGYTLENIVDPHPANNPETEFFASQVKVRCLHGLTECFPAKQRIVFCLAMIIGLPHKDIANIMNCSISSVKITLHRARKRWFGFMENRCQFIKKSNPCNCKQYIRFCQQQGLLSKDFSATPDPQIIQQTREDITKLKILHNLYRELYREKVDVTFAQRIKDGITNKEWVFFS